MIWLFVATWISGQSPLDYKIQAKVGPFETKQQCYSAGALIADKIQSKDEVTNFLGACKESDEAPRFMEMDSMWEMACKVEGFKSEWCGKTESSSK